MLPFAKAKILSYEEVYFEDRYEKLQGFQPVYLADPQGNLIGDPQGKLIADPVPIKASQQHVSSDQ